MLNLFWNLNVFILNSALTLIFFLCSHIFLNWWFFLIRLKLLWLIHLRIFIKIISWDILRFLIWLSIEWLNIVWASLFRRRNHKKFNFINLLSMIIISLMQNFTFLKIPKNDCSIVWSGCHVPIAFTHLYINYHVTVSMKRCLKH